MNVEPAEAELAYTYAWWLTGSEHAAKTAVLAALDRPDVPGADAQLRLEILLRRVRAAAVSAPTMCPASELALLHDAIGLGLDSAAGLAMIDAREARTELAHGRLEALGPDTEFEITEPQRLGGLAVGNPADVAAARQNEKLAQLREAILKGRDELVGVSRIDIPFDLLDAIASRHDGSPIPVEPMEEGWMEAGSVDTPLALRDEQEATPSEGGSAGEAGPEASDAPTVQEGPAAPAPTTSRASAVTAAAALAQDDGEEIDLSGRVGETTARLSPAAGPGRLLWLTLAVLVVAGGAAMLLLQGQGDGRVAVADDPAGGPAPTAAGDDDVVMGPQAPQVDDAGASDAAASDVSPSDAGASDVEASDVEASESVITDPTATEDAAAAPGGTEAGSDPTEAVATDLPFTVERAGVAVGIGGEPDFDNPVAGPFDPVSITVEYTGALEGDALVADWTVDDVPFDTERADLSPLLDTSRFTKQVPEEGWPVGQHTLSLVLERTGEVVGEARFQIR